MLAIGGYVIYVVVCMNSMENKVNDGARFGVGGRVSDVNVARECKDTTVSPCTFDDSCNDNDHKDKHASTCNTDEVKFHRMDLISKPTNNA